MSSNAIHILQLSVDIAFSIITLSVNTCSVFDLLCWCAACEFGIAPFMRFHVLSIRMMTSTFLIMDRSTIGLTLMQTSFWGGLASGVKIPDFISIGHFLCLPCCSAYLQFVCELLQVHISEVPRIYHLFHSFCFP